MAGENPDEQKGEAGEFASAPVGHRIFVAIAGPVMNFLLGIILFSFVYLIGLDHGTMWLMEMLVGRSDQMAQIGLVADDSPAKQEASSRATLSFQSTTGRLKIGRISTQRFLPTPMRN